jgi:hypothetical protein
MNLKLFALKSFWKVVVLEIISAKFQSILDFLFTLEIHRFKSKTLIKNLVMDY